MSTDAPASVRQLSAFDAQFVAGESEKMFSHYCALWTAGDDAHGKPLTVERVKALVASRLDRIPALRWKLQSVPLGLEHPAFVDSEVNLDEHILGGTVAAPGGREELAAAAAEIMAVRLDRSKPLWEFHVLDGLEGGRVAVAMKFHHAAADALSAAMLMTLLLDVEPEGRDDLPEPVPLTRAPGLGSRAVNLVGDLASQPARTIRAGLNTLPHLDSVPMMRTLPGARHAAKAARTVRRLTGNDGPEPEFHHAPRMRFNGRLSDERVIAFGSVDVERVKRVKAKHGVTFNDVVVAAVAGGLRAQLEKRDELPEDPLLAFVPLNVRSENHSGQIENAISSFIVPIPTDVADGAGRIAAATEAMTAAKEMGAAAPTTLLTDANAMLAPVVFGPLAAGILKIMGTSVVAPPVNLTLSNVPGPPVTLYLDGAPLEHSAPLSLIFEGATVNITVVSYAGNLEIGLVGEASAIDDAWEIIAAIQDEFAALDG